MKHTPGPWNFVAQIPENYSIEGPGGNGEVLAITALADDEVDSANARLIAQAPKLLEACKTMYDFLKGHGYSHGAMDVWKELIANAEGSQLAA